MRRVGARAVSARSVLGRTTLRPVAAPPGPAPARDPRVVAPRGLRPPRRLRSFMYTVCNLLRITQNSERGGRARYHSMCARGGRETRGMGIRPRPRREVCGPPQSNPCRSSHVPSTLPHEQNSTTIPRPVASGQPSAPEPVAHEHPLLSVSQTDVSALAHTAHIHSAHIQRGTSRDDPVTAPGFGLRRTADNTASSDILLPAAPSSLGISHPMQHAAR